MIQSRKKSYSRREFLQLSWTVSAGLVLPAVMYGCNSGGDSGLPLPDETFVEPTALTSVGGELDVTLKLAYLRTTLDGKAVTLRNMYGSIPAPTLRVNVGDKLRIQVINQLPPNPPSSEPTKHLRYPNSTNLHLHGLHVSPGLVSAGVYGDYVVDDPQLGVQPGSTRQHEYQIGLDHPPGAYWYHPHLHGSSAIQVGSGMAGALIIKGPIDLVPEIAAAVERVFMFQAPITDATGMLESFTQVADVPLVEPPFLINGVRRPRLVMRRGEVQNWHFINASIFKFVNLSLDNHALNVYSLDGNTRSSMLPVGPFALPTPSNVTGVVLAPGNRASVLVQAGAAGTYYLRTLPFQMGIDESNLSEDILAEVVVVDESRPMALPTGPLPVPASLAPITDEELASAGGLKRSIVMRAVDFDPANPPANPVVNPGNRTRRLAVSNRKYVDRQRGVCPRRRKWASFDKSCVANRVHSLSVKPRAEANGGARQCRGMDYFQHEQRPASVPYSHQSVSGRKDQRPAGRTVLGRHDRVAARRIADRANVGDVSYPVSGFQGDLCNALPYAGP